MLNNYFTLAALINEIREKIEFSHIAACLTHVESTLGIVVEKSAGDRKALVISCKPRMNYLFLDEMPMKRLSGANVLPEVVGAVIVSIFVEENERVVVLRLSNGLSLSINLFGPHANIYLVDDKNGVVGAFLKKKVSAHRDSANQISKQSFPRSAEEFVDRFKAITGDPSKRLSKIIPTFGGELAKEAMYRLGGEEATAVAGDREATLRDDQLIVLFDKISEMHRELVEPHPRIYLENDAPFVFSLIEMEHLSIHYAEIYESVNSCVGAFVRGAERRSSQVELKNTVLDRLRKEKNDLTGTVVKIEQDISGHREEKYRAYGELLMQHLDEIEKGTSSFEAYQDGVLMNIPLDVRLNAVRNAQVYFERAKKARESHRQAISRLEELRKSLDMIEAELKKIENETDRRQLLSIERVERAKDDANTPFRQFEKNGYRIYVGKDAKNNDELTFGFAKPNDVFLHARGVSGSHVIIRNASRDFPQKPVLQFAASIAAHYSKARSSGIVPVAYTMRKFVKKARGKPGAVIVNREEVIFVKPEIPKNSR